MADNIAIPGGTVRTRDIGSVHYQVTIAAKADGSIINPATEEGQNQIVTVVGDLISATALEVTQQLVLDELGEQTTALETIATNAASTDPAAVVFDTASMRNGTTALTPKYAAISASASGDNTIVTAVAGKKIRVLAYNLIGAGAVSARFQSGASGAYLTGAKAIAGAGGGICAPFNPVGWFETAAAALLNLELSDAVAVGGEIVYVEV